MKTLTTVQRRALAALGAGGIGLLAVGGGGITYLVRRLNRVASYPEAQLEAMRAGRSNPMFDRYPRLRARIPWRPLGTFPTPIEPLALTAPHPESRIFVKREDLASPLYGGNKVRKLEHLLAEAALAGRRRVVTLGGIGSNHALATALHGAEVGLQTDLVLYDQPITPTVRRNLAAFLSAGATLHAAGSVAGALLRAARVMARRRSEGDPPYFIMVGGTSLLGCVGHVSAALELADQLRGGGLPRPDRIFVPVGTCGTAAGLIVGLKLAGLPTRVTGVRVADALSANSTVLRWMAQQLADFLHAADPAVPKLTIGATDFDLVTEYLGEGYGHPTAAAEQAVHHARAQLKLETTYTGKTLAACLDHARSARGPTTLLFWNSYSSAPLPSQGAWSGLPPRLRHLAE